MNINDLLTQLTQNNGSDLHLKVGTPPIIRKKTKLYPLNSNLPAVNYQMMQELLSSIITDIHQTKLDKYGSVDIGYGLKGIGRFRFNIFFQRGSLRAVIRHIPHIIPTPEELNLPKQLLKTIKTLNRGLVLVTGTTGVGKSTTLVSLLNHINHTQNKHIITIEDPIEFLIQDHHSLITQRELGIDCTEANQALKSALRQDPDIIFFSEIRSKDIISTALMAAETGHLIFSTLHTSDAAEAITRILSVFSDTEQKGIQLILSSVLQAIFSQRLIMKKDKSGLIPVIEILINTPTIREIIKENPSSSLIRDTIIKGSYWGMNTFDQHLIKMLIEGLISMEEALKQSTSPEKIKLASSDISF